MAITYFGGNAADAVAGQSITADIGVAGNNRLVVVGTAAEANTTLTCTVDGKAATLHSRVHNAAGATNTTHFFYMLESDLGASAGTVTIAVSGGTGADDILCATWYGVAQTVPDDTATDATSTGTTTTVNGLDVPADGLCVFLAGQGGNGAISSLTSPLVARQSVVGSNSTVIAEAIESPAATNKTYVVTWVGATNRSSGTAASWAAAPTGGTYNQASFRARDDIGGESATIWKAAINTDWEQLTDLIFRVRFLIQEEADVEDTDVELQLQYNHNSGGWNDVNSSSSVVRSVGSSNLTDGQDTTQQLGSGTFVTPNSGVDELNGITGGTSLDFSTTANQEVEVEYALYINSLVVDEGDTVQLRLVKEPDIVLDTYTNIPTMTVPYGTGMMLATADRLLSTAALENPSAYTFGRSLGWGAITVALRPAVSSSASNLDTTSKFSSIRTTATVTTRDGGTINGQTINGNYVMDNVEDLTDVTVNGDLTINTAGTYNFSNVTVTGDVTNADGTGNALVQLGGGSSATTSEPGTGNGEVDLSQVVTITLSGLVPGSSVHVENTTDSVVLFNETESTSEFSDTVSYTSDKAILVRVRNHDGSPYYKTFTTTGTLTSSGYSTVINQLLDE